MILSLVVLLSTISVLTAAPASAAPGDECFVVADKGDFPGLNDLMARVDVTRNVRPMTETTLGFTGTTGIEALTAQPGTGDLWAAVDTTQGGKEVAILGRLSKTVPPVFTPLPNPLGNGTGSFGQREFIDPGGLAFSPDGTLFVTLRRGEIDANILGLVIKASSTTGSSIANGFGPANDYLAIPAPAGLTRAESGEAPRIVFHSDGRMLAIADIDGTGSHLIEIRITDNADPAPDTIATIDIGPTGQAADPDFGAVPDDIDGLASGPSGLWGVNTTHEPERRSYLWQIDAATGAATIARPLGLESNAHYFEVIACPSGGEFEPLIRKFHDVNGNAVRDLGERGLVNWEFHLIGLTNAEHVHVYTNLVGERRLSPADVPPGRYLVCETLKSAWQQTAPSPGADCTGHTHGNTITPGPRGFDVQLFVPNVPAVEMEFGNNSCTDDPKASSNARAYGVRADLLGGGLILGDPDIPPTPDSDVTNPGQLLAVPNPLVPGQPLATLLTVSENETTDTATATATTASVDIDTGIALLAPLRVQADAVKSVSTSYREVFGASSSSEGSTIVNLRIGTLAYGDVSEPVSIVVKNPLTGAPLGEVHVLERVRRNAAAGLVQPESDGADSRSGLDVIGVHVVVYDLAETTFLNEASDIKVAFASTDIAFRPLQSCPSVSGDAFVAKLFNVTLPPPLAPNVATVTVGEVKLPSTGGKDTEHLVDAAVPMLLSAKVADTSTELDSATANFAPPNPDRASVSSRATVADAVVTGVATAKLIEARANASCEGTVAAPKSCPNTAVNGETVIADVRILGIDVCSTLGLAATCRPAPNTVLLDITGVIRVVLNEQIMDADGRGITVNAVHIYLLAAAGPLLPAGAEVIISSAHADTHPRFAECDDNIDNDNDGRFDFDGTPADPQCANAADDSEVA